MPNDLDTNVDVFDENTVDFSSLEKLVEDDISKDKIDDLVDKKIKIEKSSQWYVVFVDGIATFLLKKDAEIKKFVEILEDVKLDSTDIDIGFELLALNVIIDKNPSTLTILKWSDFQEKVGDKFDVVGEKVEKTVQTYLKGLFGEDFYKKNSVVLDQMFGAWSTGIQFMMIEAIGEMNNADATIAFFDSFSDTNFSNAISAFTGLFKTFSKWNEFVSLAKKVENCCQFLAKNKENLVKSQSALFYNPYFFKEMLMDSAWDDNSVLAWQNWEDIVVYVLWDDVNLEDDFGSWNKNLTETQKNILLSIADDDLVLNNINIKFIDNLAEDDWVVDKALDFLWKRGDYQWKISWLYETVQWIFDVEMFGISAKTVLWADSIEDFLDSDEHSGLKSIVDFVLGILWFVGGFDGLKTSYQSEQLLKLVKNNDFVKNGLSNFQDEFSNNEIQFDDNWSTFSRLGLADVSDLISNEQIVGIVPQNYWLLDVVMKSALELDPNVSSDLLSFDWLKGFLKKNKDWILKIPKTKREKFSKKYLNIMIKQILLEDNLMEDIMQESDPKSAFMVVLLGTIQAGTLFWKSHDLWSLDNFDYDSEKVVTTNVDMTIVKNDESVKNRNEIKESLKWKKLSEINFEEAKNFAYIVRGAGPATELMIEKSNGNPSLIIRATALAKHENNLKFGTSNQALVEDSNSPDGFKRDNTTWTDIGTFQIHSDGSETDAWDRYNGFLKDGIDMYSWNVDRDKLSRAQMDLFSWFGYVKTRDARRDNSDKNLFNMLTNPSLSDADLKKLMYKRIQAGNKGIGDKVLANLDLETNRYFALSDFSDELVEVT